MTSTVLRALIWMCAMFLAAISLFVGGSYVITPWAHAYSGHPALVGYWRGEMAFEPGDTRQVALHLRKFLTLADILLDRGGSPGSEQTPDIRVAATLCGPKGRGRYHGSGDVDNRQGTRFTFGLAPDDAAPGKHPNEFTGVWNGMDRLEFTARLYAQGPDAATAETSTTARPGASDSPGLIRFELQRSTEAAFDAAC